MKGKLTIQNAILRYLDAPEDESLAREISSFRSDSVENEAFFLEIKRIWEASAETARLENLNEPAALEKFRVKIGSTRLHRRPLVSYWMRIAAIILFFSAIGYWFYNKQNNDPVYIVKENSSNHTDSLLLMDGTKIMLAAGASVKYPKEFDKDERRIELLNGQAFFSVAKNAKHPFTVQIGHSVVRVLGTSFNIRFSPLEIQLAVKTGRVSFTPNSNSTPSVLDAGDALRYNLTRNEINRENGSNATAWLTNELHFVDTPLDEVCRQLSEHYAVKIVLGSSVNPAKKLNANFKNNSLDEVLDLLTETYPLSVTKSDTLITIKSL